jgi:hypothetical protein
MSENLVCTAHRQIAIHSKEVMRFLTERLVASVFI